MAHSNRIKIGIIGTGMVGSAIARGFNLFADVSTYDIDPKKCANTLEEALDNEFIFVCLPTPMEKAEGGQADLSVMLNFFSIIGHKYLDILNKNDSVVVIKSTVPIGTTSQLIRDFPNFNIVHSPEFLTARCANLDFITPARNIIGGYGKSVERLSKLYIDRFPGVPCYAMRPEESELVKYAANCFFATKVIFFNEMKLLCDSLNMNWDNVLTGVFSDGRIAKSHYQVPGHDGDAGFGGFCFPKDINALISVMESLGIDPLVLKAVWQQNKNVRKNWDWATNPSAVTQSKQQ